MQIYKTFLKLIKSNFTSIFIYFVIFIALCFTFSKVGKTSDTQNFNQTKLKIMIDNQDEGVFGKSLVEYLSQNNSILAIPEDENLLLDKIYNREADYVLYIPNDFTSRFINGDREELLTSKKIPSTSTAMLADTQINQYLSTLSLYTDSGFSEDDSVAEVKKDLELKSQVFFLDGSSAEQMPEASYYFRYIPYIFLSIMILCLGGILMAFQRKEVRDRNRCSSMPATRQTLQLLLGCIVFAIIIFVIFIASAFVLYPDYMMEVRGFLSMSNAFMFLGVSLVISLLVGHLAKSSNSLTMIGNLIGLSLSFLGGVFVPLIIFGDSVLTLAKFTPTYWYTSVNEALQKINSFSEITPTIYIGFLVQGGFFLAILSAVLMVSKKR